VTRTWGIVAAMLLASAQARAAEPAPDACKLVTLSDVDAALGGGFAITPDPFAGKMSGESSTCVYGKGPGNSASIFIIRNLGGSARIAVLARQQAQKRAGRSVTPIPGLCDAAFSVAINPKKANVIAAKGVWQVETEVMVGGTADARAAQKLAEVACASLSQGVLAAHPLDPPAASRE
jgi:hypothetical protein